jgi:hypothetical protein
MNNTLKECANKSPITILVNSNHNVALNVFAGSVNLTRRLENIVAIRVLYFNIINSTFNMTAFGTIRVLRSSMLGSLLRTNAYQVAQSLDTNPSTAIAWTDVIAWSGPPSALTNVSSNANQGPIQPMLYFSNPATIEHFDWAIQSIALTSSLVTPSQYAFECAIEFYTVCDCD